MPTFLLLLLGLAAGCVRALGSSREEVPAVVALPLKKEGGGLGDPCVESRCGPGTNTVCSNKTKTCMCDSYHPVSINDQLCAKGALLGTPCFHHDQCQYYDANSMCQEEGNNRSQCQCQEKYELRYIEGLSIPKVCFPDLESLKADVPTLLGLGLALSMLSALICLVLKIFARARFARPRRYADARINPPLTVSETYAAFALAANASSSSSPARGRQSSIRLTKSASSSRRPSYSSLHSVRPVSLIIPYSSSFFTPPPPSPFFHSHPIFLLLLLFLYFFSKFSFLSLLLLSFHIYIPPSPLLSSPFLSSPPLIPYKKEKLLI
ncbi:hypothetical protein O3P69_003326 [Scylla paramamosain]|uniref:EB domain-containing protein n=1 Tax=Scylla paramamosain TaxID=85552 RepID=A0AAW0UL28_SCYPA